MYFSLFLEVYINTASNDKKNQWNGHFAYDLAGLFYENLAFEESDIEDVILIRAGFYDSFQSIIDTVLILGYRKTGFEDINY